jgi:hypothetical protein
MLLERNGTQDRQFKSYNPQQWELSPLPLPAYFPVLDTIILLQLSDTGCALVLDDFVGVVTIRTS